MTEQVETPAPSPEPIQPVVTPQESPSIRAAFEKRQFDVSNFQSDDEVLDAIETTWQEQQRLAQENEQLRQYAASQQPDPEYATWKSERAKTLEAEAAAKAAEKKTKWEAPALDESWTSRATWDESQGRFLPNTIADRDAADGLNKFVKFKQSFEQRQAADPIGVLREAGLHDELEQFLSPREKALAERLEKLEAYHAQRETAQVQGEHEAFVAANEAHLFQLDDQGQRIRDANGFALTPLGQQASRIWNREARRQNPTNDPNFKLNLRDIHEAIVDIIGPQIPVEQPVPQRGAPRGPDGKFLPRQEQAPAEPPAMPPPKMFMQSAAKRLNNGAGRSANQHGSTQAPELDDSIFQNGELTDPNDISRAYMKAAGITFNR